MVGRAAKVGQMARRLLRSGICLGAVACAGLAPGNARAEDLPQALVKAYQSNPQLNAERARQRLRHVLVGGALAGPFRVELRIALVGLDESLGQIFGARVTGGEASACDRAKTNARSKQPSCHLANFSGTPNHMIP